MKKIVLLVLLLCSMQQVFAQQRYFKYRFYAAEEAKADSLEKLRERRNSKIEQDSEGMVMVGKKKYQLISAFDSSLIRKKMKYDASRRDFISRGGFGRVTFAKPNRVILEPYVVKAYFRYEKNKKALNKMNLASFCNFIGPGLLSIGLGSAVMGTYLFLDDDYDGPFYQKSGFILMTGGFTLLAGGIAMPGISHRLYKESIKVYNSGLTKKKKTKTAMLMPHELRFGTVQTAFTPASPVPAIGFRWKL